MPYEIESAFDWSKLDNHNRFHDDGTPREPHWSCAVFRDGKYDRLLKVRTFKTEQEARTYVTSKAWMYKRYIMWRIIHTGSHNKVPFRDVIGEIIHNWDLKDEFGAVIVR